MSLVPHVRSGPYEWRGMESDSLVVPSALLSVSKFPGMGAWGGMDPTLDRTGPPEDNNCKQSKE